MASFLRLHPTDNVVVAVNGLSPGDIVDDVKITRRIPPGHKAAVRPIPKDEPGHPVKHALQVSKHQIRPIMVHRHRACACPVARDFAGARSLDASG